VRVTLHAQVGTVLIESQAPHGKESGARRALAQLLRSGDRMVTGRGDLAAGLADSQRGLLGSR